jgi:hypothetical protein
MGSLARIGFALTIHAEDRQASVRLAVCASFATTEGYYK